ncbi:apolipoprotein A-II [Colossoma macropomum]|uniref:apolipoprotein A-II n=1 Tax=Colossoma macropomum TaxID=42526 RepID=UPI001864D7F0|nr:apolipoprotein A-II [Colossoma macropomum]
MKLALALIVALQVSVCLCDLPQPSKELVDKYTGLKETFLKRIVHFYEKVHESLETLAEGTITGDKAKELAEHVKSDHRAQAIGKLISGLAEDLDPLVEKVRLTGLGVYEEYLRPHIGEQLDHFIASVKPVLDTILPAEES